MSSPFVENWRYIEIIGASVFRDGHFIDETVYVSGDRFVNEDDFFVASQQSPIDIIDGTDLLLLPGLTDLHLHGAASHDMSDANTDGLHRILRYEASCGVTQIVLTSLTASDHQLEAVFKACGDVYRRGGVADGAWLAGLHMEGPYINKNKCGAQNQDFIRKPSLTEYERLNGLAGGTILIVSLAPEVDGGLSFISQLKEEVVVSIAHTTASYEQAMTAFDAGASHVTHLYNAMPPFHHRQPGVIGAAADQGHVSVELIADGVHVHPSVIRSTFNLFPGRVVLISDSMRATGLGDGVYDLGGLAVTVKDNRATLEDTSIAGSITTLYDCLRFAVQHGVPLDAAVYAASEYPASRIGIMDEAGTVKPGRRANFMLTERDLTRRHVFINGQQTHPRCT